MSNLESNKNKLETRRKVIQSVLIAEDIADEYGLINEDRAELVVNVMGRANKANVAVKRETISDLAEGLSDRRWIFEDILGIEVESVFGIV